MDILYALPGFHIRCSNHAREVIAFHEHILIQIKIILH